MFGRSIALLMIAGACGYPHDDENTVLPHAPIGTFISPVTGHFDPEGPVDPESGQRDTVSDHVSSETFPLKPENGPVQEIDPEGSLPHQNVIDSAEVPEASAQDGPKIEGDLKTDATWWPIYRSVWIYPPQRRYWTYPYSYYRPRTYYKYYYW